MNKIIQALKKVRMVRIERWHLDMNPFTGTIDNRTLKTNKPYVIVCSKLTAINVVQAYWGDVEYVSPKEISNFKRYPHSISFKRGIYEYKATIL